jgi:hypothetical protein
LQDTSADPAPEEEGEDRDGDDEIMEMALVMQHAGQKVAVMQKVVDAAKARLLNAQEQAETLKVHHHDGFALLHNLCTLGCFHNQHTICRKRSRA